MTLCTTMDGPWGELLLIVRPCDRVIGADGSLTGYAGGLERKQQLLRREGVAESIVQAAA